jgi:hypothetical protein
MDSVFGCNKKLLPLRVVVAIRFQFKKISKVNKK